MKQVPVSKFKANCSSFIKQVRETKRSIQITRRGKVIAEIRPIPSEKLQLAPTNERDGRVILSRHSLIFDQQDYERRTN